MKPPSLLSTATSADATQRRLIAGIVLVTLLTVAAMIVVLAIGGSIAPPLLLLTILFLGSERPLPNAGALALGYFAACAVTGISGLNSSNIDAAGHRIDPTQFDRLYVDVYCRGVE